MMPEKDEKSPAKMQSASIDEALQSLDSNISTQTLESMKRSHPLQTLALIVGGLVLVTAIVFGMLVASGTIDVELQPNAEMPTVEVVTNVNIASNEYLVLIAALDHTGGSNRDVTGGIVDELRQQFEVLADFSNLRVYPYDGIITSSEEALKAAEANNASVMVWGSYDDLGIQLTIQVGSLKKLPHNQFPREVIERTANIKVQLTDEMVQSIAPQVANVLAVMQVADGNMIETARAIAVANGLEVAGGSLIGGSTATNTHLFLSNYLYDIPTAGSAISTAINADTENALLYVLRAMLRNRQLFFSGTTIRADAYPAIHQDIVSAQQLGTAQWGAPYLLDLLLYKYYARFDRGGYKGALGSPDELITALIQQRPDDWYAAYLAGSLMQVFNRQDEAQAYIERSIALSTDMNLPQVIGVLQNLAAGNIKEASLLIEEQPTFLDPTRITKVITILSGNPTVDATLASVFHLYLNEDYTAAMQEAQQFLTATYGRNTSSLNNAGLLLFSGLSQCNLHNNAAARGAYDAVRSEIAAFAFADLMALEIRLNLEQSTESTLNRLQRSAQSEQLAPYVQAIKAGTLGCTNILDITALEAAEAAYVPEATPEATAEAD